MKRALVISAVVHLALLIGLWQVSLTLSPPVSRGYPRLMTATLVAKPASAAVSTPSAPEPPAAVVSTPAPTPAPALEPIAKTETPANVVAPAKPQKKMPPASKQSLQRASESSTKSPGPGKGGAGSGSGNMMKIDAPEFAFSYYLVAVQNQIERQWQAPFSGQGQRVATVHFKISRSGEIEEVQLEQSSGNVVFDQAAMRAVYYANPLPPLPAGSGLQSLGVHFDFVAY